MCPSAFTLKPSDCESAGQSCLKIKSAVRRLCQRTRDALQVQAKQKSGEQLSMCRAQGTGGLQDPRCRTPAAGPLRVTEVSPSCGAVLHFPALAAPLKAGFGQQRSVTWSRGLRVGWEGALGHLGAVSCQPPLTSQCQGDGRGVLLCRAGDISGCSW